MQVPPPPWIFRPCDGPAKYQLIYENPVVNSYAFKEMKLSIMLRSEKNCNSFETYCTKHDIGIQLKSLFMVHVYIYGY